ncbi:hypothetical protein W02_25130 [Nitrospira sp. KM1]|uniref:two-partner secretion domain-containing protein n=1 Tax=Nitrospira sp. KM1 TaxID=1936990 RepID=UPI0013A7AD54|nr:filamentous hemagglutinin N-terminal domain-containing protein [Nitrospira sp. KM1]BCA55373.1 hypothetical protein W02_25130 [Nitrospira sp. KM1]
MRDHLYPQSHLNKTHARILTQQDRLHRLAAGFHGRASLSRALRCLLASVQILMPTLAAALPADGTVVGGRATIQLSTGKALTIQQTTDKAILNWKSFSIGQGESVQFVQPSASSVALNRVLGTDPSIILGRLQANGRLVLLNPNGVLFGAGSQINVGGLLATTLQIRDSDFMAGHYLFAQDPLKTLGTVVNRGAIQISDHGFVFLVAPGVSNEGLIVANLGQVVLGSGRQFTMDMMGDGLINYAIDGKVLSRLTGMDGAPLASAVGNSGTIIAGGGQVILSAKASGEVFSSVVNQSGVIRARSLAGEGGIVRLEGSDPVTNTGRIGWKTNLGQVKHADGIVLHTGEIDVSAAQPGASQGQVTITGETVRLSGNILARGTDGSQGGRILIASTKNTVATTDSVVDASGAGHSSAGNVVVWSDRDTRFNGNILARGGDQSGNGGQVEVSGHERLGFNGHVNALAPNGMTGSLLLDPLSITVATGGAATLAQVDQFGDTPAANQTIDSATINAAAANVTLQANADVTVSNPISMTNNGVGISMQAGRNINVNAAVTTNNGNISLSANDSNAISANRTAGAGGITFGAAGSLSAGSGDIALSVGSSSTAPFNPGAITTVRNLTTTTGNIAITSPNGVSLSGIVNAGSGTISINANTDGAGAQGLTMNAGSSIATTNSGGNAVQLVVNSPAGGTGTAALRGSISTGGGGTTLITTRGQTGAGGNITGGAITQGAVLTVDTGASGTIDLATGDPAAGITLNTAGNDFIGAIGVSRAFNVALRDANALILGPSTISGTLAVTTAGPLTQSGALAVTGTTTLAAGAANNITLTDAGNAFSTVAITSGNNVALTDATALALAASTVSGTLGVTTNGALTQTGVVTVTGATTLAAGSANDINLGTAANNFSTVTVTSGNNVALRDTNALILGPSTVGGTLGVTTGGALTQSGALSVTGATTFTATVANTDVLLGTQANTFSGPLGFAGTLTNFRDVQLRNVNAAATVPVLAGLTNLRNLTLTHDNAAVALPALTLAAGGTLTVTAGGAITDSGALVIPGTTTLTAGANPITLDNANNFTGAVSVPSAAAVTLNDINALALGPSTIAGPLTVTTGGALTQSGALSVTGATTFTATATNSDVFLGTQVNNFGGALAFAGTQANFRDVSLRNVNAGATVPALAGLTNLRNLTLTFNNASIALPPTVLKAGGNLSVTAGGTITDSGNLVVPGTTTLTAGAANNITLDNANNFTGAVSILTGNNVMLNDINALNLGTSTISGTLGVTTNGALTQSGALTITGATTLTAGAANNITLNNAANNFSTVGITSANNVVLTDANALNLATSTISGSLNVTAGSLISQSGALTVAGAASFDTTAAGAMGSVTLTNGNALAFNTSTVGGNLTAATTAGDLTLPAGQTLTVAGDATLTPAGNVNLLGTTRIGGTQSSVGSAGASFVLGTDTNLNALPLPGTGPITVTTTGTTATFTGPALLPSAIMLNNAGNHFSGPVSVTTATSAFTGTITNTYHLTQSAPVTLNVGQNLTVTDLGGTTGTRGNITLPNTGNSFETVNFTGGNITWAETGPVTIGSVSANAGATSAGTLGITATGPITQTGMMTVAGATVLAAGPANNITLNNAANNFSTVGIASGNNVSLTDANALTLSASTVNGNISVSASDLTIGGALTSSGGILNLNATNSVTQLANLATDGPNTVTVSTSGGPIAMLATAMSTTGAGAIIYSAGTDVTLGSLTTGGAVNVAANNGSVMSAPGSGVNVSAGGNSTLQAFNGVVGTQISPLQVNVNAGMLSIRAATAVSGISAFVTGRVSPGNSLSLLNAPPGLVCFNGCYVPATSPTAGFMGFVPSFNRDSVIPSYLYEPTGPNMIAVISTYLPETIVAETPIDIGSDEPSVAREIPPCFPINACRTGSTLLTAPAEDKDADATAR